MECYAKYCVIFMQIHFETDFSIQTIPSFTDCNEVADPITI